MKSLTLTLAAVAVALAACDQKDAAAAAMDKAKSAAGDVASAAKGAVGDMAGMADVGKIGDIVSKFSSLKTDGMPTEMVGLVDSIRGPLGQLGDLTKGLPTDMAGLKDVFTKNAGLWEKIGPLMSKVMPLITQLKEMAAKHGINLGF